ncbi:MAG: BLUF domain-containing protein [Flavobacteriaceae bacterium]|nr:BLUF domain-containing protein [Flavobacteriaceae bacterium]
MTYTLTYESEIVEPMDSHQMGLLLEQSGNNNKRDNITGCLIYYMGGFIQVLEGEKTKVLDLYEKIKLDKRHKNVHMFSEDDNVERSFPNWGMAYYPIDAYTTNKSEFEQFKRNLLLLADFTVPKHLTAKLFWERTKFLITNPPKNI